MKNQPSTSKHALILDFDGVVVATERLHFECWNAAFDELLGIRIDGDHRRLAVVLAAVLLVQLGRLQEFAVLDQPHGRGDIVVGRAGQHAGRRIGTLYATGRFQHGLLFYG